MPSALRKEEEPCATIRKEKDLFDSWIPAAQSWSGFDLGVLSLRPLRFREDADVMAGHKCGRRLLGILQAGEGSFSALLKI